MPVTYIILQRQHRMALFFAKRRPSAVAELFGKGAVTHSLAHSLRVRLPYQRRKGTNDGDEKGKCPLLEFPQMTSTRA